MLCHSKVTLQKDCVIFKLGYLESPERLNWIGWSPVPIYLQILWNEDFAGFLYHWLRLELLLGKLALTRVKNVLARNTGKSKISRVGFIPHRDLNCLGVDGTWSVTTGRQDLTYSKRTNCVTKEMEIMSLDLAFTAIISTLFFAFPSFFHPIPTQWCEHPLGSDLGPSQKAQQNL